MNKFAYVLMLILSALPKRPNNRLICWLNGFLWRWAEKLAGEPLCVFCGQCFTDKANSYDEPQCDNCVEEGICVLCKEHTTSNDSCCGAAVHTFE